MKPDPFRFAQNPAPENAARPEWAVVGARYRVGDFKGVWEIVEVQERGVVVVLVDCGAIGPHKHLDTWGKMAQWEAKPL